MKTKAKISVAASFFLVLPFLVLAQEASTERDASSPAVDLPFEKLNLFLDQFFENRMKENSVPGAVIAVVQGDSILFSRGYGYADMEKMIPADPVHSLFRIGSVTKPVVAAAAMKLIEEGLLDPNEDVNHYLADFKVDSPPENPVTLVHLLTHSAGFDVRVIGSRAPSHDLVSPPSEYLATHMPRRVRMPGEVMSYSNHSFTLLGYIVEAVSGMPLEKYLEEQFFIPLGMNSTLMAPDPDKHEQIARAYQWNDGSWLEQDWIHYQIAAGGGIVATAEDMARFAKLHLAPESTASKCIMSVESVRRMHQRWFSHHPEMPGMAWSLFEWNPKSWQTLEHGGSTGGFISQLMLLPEEGVGVFVSQNGGKELTSELMLRFLEEFIPESNHENPEQLSPETRTESSGLSGTYRFNRTTTTMFTHAFKLVQPGEEVEVITETPGEITIKRNNQPHWFFHAKAGHYIEIEPMLFYNPESGEKLAFIPNQKGEIKYLGVPAGSYTRTGLLDSQGLNFAWRAFSWPVLFSAVMMWPTGVILQRRRNEVPELTIRLTRLLMGLVSMIILVFIVAFNVEARFHSAGWSVGDLGRIPMILWMPILAAVISVPALAGLMIAWRKGAGSVSVRIYYSMVGIAIIGTFAFFTYWRLMGFNY